MDIDYLYEEWIEKLYDEWPLEGTLITRSSGAQRRSKKNAGEISIAYLALVLKSRTDVDVSLTVWSRDADCRNYMKEVALIASKRGWNNEFSYKPLESTLKQIYKDKIIEDTEYFEVVDATRTERKICYSYLKDDNSLELREELVDNKKFKDLVKNDRTNIIW